MTTTRESTDRFEQLDHRSSGGIHVSLLWNRTTNALNVLAVDTKTDENFALRVDSHEAMEVFRHPFAYADSHPVHDELVRKEHQP